MRLLRTSPLEFLVLFRCASVLPPSAANVGDTVTVQRTGSTRCYRFKPLALTNPRSMLEPGMITKTRSGKLRPAHALALVN